MTRTRKKPQIVDLEFRPHKHQANFLSSWKRYNELICTRRFGKSVSAITAMTDFPKRRVQINSL